MTAYNPGHALTSSVGSMQDDLCPTAKLQGIVVVLLATAAPGLEGALVQFFLFFPFFWLLLGTACCWRCVMFSAGHTS